MLFTDVEVQIVRGKECTFTEYQVSLRDCTGISSCFIESQLDQAFGIVVRYYPTPQFNGPLAIAVVCDGTLHGTFKVLPDECTFFCGPIMEDGSVRPFIFSDNPDNKDLTQLGSLFVYIYHLPTGRVASQPMSAESATPLGKHLVKLLPPAELSGNVIRKADFDLNTVRHRTCLFRFGPKESLEKYPVVLAQMNGESRREHERECTEFLRNERAANAAAESHVPRNSSIKNSKHGPLS